MDSNQQVPLPQTLGEVEALIKQLYQPGTPQNVARVQETLQKVQRSPEGWQLASTLMESSDDKVQFFGALTFIVKLNSDSQSLSEEDANALLLRLIGWLVQLLHRSTGPLVIRKLCSALVTYFIHFSASWTRCIHHLVCSLYANQPVVLEALQEAPAIEMMVSSLPAEKLLVASWFAAALVEEVSRTDSNSMKTYKFHTRLLENVDDVVALIGAGFAITDNVKLRQESMKCLQAWINYSHRAFIDEGIVLEPLRKLTQPALNCLTHSDMYDVTVELFYDILSNYSRFLEPQDFNLLFSILGSSWAQEKYNCLIAGDFSFEYLQLGQLMIAYGDATVEELVRNDDELSQEFVSALGGLLAAEGHAVAEDQIFVQALEFWQTFVEVMIDSLYSEEGQTAPWIETARNHVMRAIENCWRKVQFPSPEEFNSWDSTDRTGFSDARKDVADLLQSSYTLTGPPLLSMFARLVLQSLEGEAWPQLEASLYCLSALADCIGDEGTCDEVLDTVFTSAMFGILLDPSREISPRTRQTSLTTVEKYSEYFQRRPQSLPNALNFLFQSLNNPALAQTASRSIFSLCNSAGESLTPQLGAFLQQYQNSLNQPSADGIVKERVLGAIAAIIQEIPSDESRLEPLQRLLDFVSTDINECLKHGTTGNTVAAEEFAIQALRSLTSIAKALQAPSDYLVDLDGTTTVSTFWTSGPGVSVQSQVQKLIGTLVTAVPRSGEVIDAACHVFRAGFTEDAGPFAFPPHVAVQFILAADIHTPRLGSVMSMASSVVSSHGLKAGDTTKQLLSELLAWTISLLQSLQEPGDDPEISQNGIEFTYRLLPKNVDIIVEQPPQTMEFIFMFTLRTLTGRDPLPKAAAADFWTAFVTLKDQPTELQYSINKVMDHVGPLLAEALIYNIGGNALRSELDKQAEPLKKLVVRQVQAKQWLETALFKRLQNDKVTEAERRVFLQKILGLRGAKGTNQVVRDFWLACRGSSFAYTS